MPTGPSWDGFFVFGVPLHGMMYFAVGGVVSYVLGTGLKHPQIPAARVIRRQLMPVYLLHAVVIVVLGWGVKAAGRFDVLATIWGDVVMWFVGVIGAIGIGEAMRRWTPNAAKLLFGGR